jgi:hypothetical protein
VELMSRQHNIELQEDAELARELHRINAGAEKQYAKDLKGIMTPYVHNPEKPVFTVKSQPHHPSPVYDYIPFELVEKQRELEKRKIMRENKEMEKKMKALQKNQLQQQPYDPMLGSDTKSEKKRKREGGSDDENEEKGGKEDEKEKEGGGEGQGVRVQLADGSYVTYKKPSQLLTKTADDIIGVAGAWEEVKDEFTGYYSEYYKPSVAGATTEDQDGEFQYVEIARGAYQSSKKVLPPRTTQSNNNNNITINLSSKSSKPQAKTEEDEGLGLEDDDDGFGALSEHVINRVSHVMEKQPDKYQVSKLNRLTGAEGGGGEGEGEGAMFKKRKLNKGNARKTATSKDYM